MSIKQIPRPEHPRPDMKRDTWLNLNGEWEYMTDRGFSGEFRGAPKGNGFEEKIIVPFCRESLLSGIGDKDFCGCVWYKKQLTLPADWSCKGNRVRLHIGACDFKTDLYVNGKHIGQHIGGYVSFVFDITEALAEGENTLVIRAEDDTRSVRQASGKQSHCYDSFGCFYTRTTGIWQTVWLESVPETYIEGMKFYPEITRSVLRAEVRVKNGQGSVISAAASYCGKAVGEASAVVKNGVATLDIVLDELHLWDVGQGDLYDIELTVGKDRLASYFGMREVECKNGLLYLNGRPVFQRLVLDQGFYPDGIYTAPTLETLYADVDLSMATGFNGARLHEKVFEPLFLEYCDRRGYLVWGEHGNWGMEHTGDAPFANFMQEWQEIMRRDFNHPAIIGWCPLNESNPNTDLRFTQMIADLTRAIDKTRLYIDASGWKHEYGVTDILDVHDYNQDPVAFKKKYDAVAQGKAINVHEFFRNEALDYFGIPTFVSEYGGTWWSDTENGWGYGDAPKTSEDFLARFKGLTEAILFNPVMGGLCYTQLTDVEQEQNGLYTFFRKPKFDPALFRAVLIQKAKIEE